MRITEKRLQNRVKLLNETLSRPTEPHTRAEDGTLRANIGNIHINHAYGGVQLVEMITDGGGVNSISEGHSTKRELDYFLDGMFAVIYLEKK